jgi:hypothetical protein
MQRRQSSTQDRQQKHQATRRNSHITFNATMAITMALYETDSEDV